MPLVVVYFIATDRLLECFSVAVVATSASGVSRGCTCNDWIFKGPRKRAEWIPTDWAIVILPGTHAHVVSNDVESGCMSDRCGVDNGRCAAVEKLL